ncbi:MULTISPECIES: hypothetical protein [Candidatus Ichthyocystis]|uniref:Uncharacterized protein n=1 Tax=Candidatus Ichthyocystis hellenicum TaxID=1561003 RepID=A0A0S4M7B1_9BURK|nr:MULTISPECIES: hypothetical protein [Ichthyocystis]CUT18166.1 hypothetical protein Ark11_1362 [Candidatus Ichthyocystis hellenicum]
MLVDISNAKGGCFYTTSISGSLCTLLELSTAAVYGLNCKESIDRLVPLSTKDILRGKESVDIADGLEQVPSGDDSQKKELVDHLKMSPKDAIEVAKSVNSWTSYSYHSSKYESRSENSSSSTELCVNYDEICRNNYDVLSDSREIEIVLRFRNSINKIIDSIIDDLLVKHSFSSEEAMICSVHPMYHVVHAKNIGDIIPRYYDRRMEIWRLPKFPPLNIPRTSPPSPAEILHYRDPLYFLNPKLAFCNLEIAPCSRIKEFVINPLRSNSIAVDYDLCKLMVCLKESSAKMSKKSYNIIMAALLQILHSNNLLLESTSRRCVAENGPYESENLAMLSLNIVISLRNCIEIVGSIRKTLIPLLDLCNYVPLEDVTMIIRSRILNSSLGVYRSDWEREFRNISLFLKAKYNELIANKNMTIKCLLGKIDLDDEHTNNKFFSFLGIPNSTHGLGKNSIPISDRMLVIEKFLRKVFVDDIKEATRKDKSTESKDKSVENYDLVFLINIARSINNLRNEISEMNLFLINFTEEISQTSAESKS